jgi:transposase InsO family protein
MVHSERNILPRLGGRKIYHQIQPKLKNASIKLGRDGLFVLLRSNNLSIEPRRRYIQTTNSKHWLRRYPNLIKTMPVTEPEQLWVSDITYIKTDEGNCYLNLVTDAYSRKIMGYSIAENMDTTSMKKAYQMAIAQRTYPQRSLIHHSDRGLQYCSSEYVKLSIDNEIKISMTENGDPYENALAERMNRTLKEEFGLGRKLSTRQQAIKLTQEAISLYNNNRPHLSLKMNTPQNVHLQKIPATVATGIQL